MTLPSADFSHEVRLRREAAKKALSHWCQHRASLAAKSASHASTSLKVNEGSESAQAVLEVPQVPPPAEYSRPQPAEEDFSSALLLESIRQSLIRQEDTIIYCLIERGQFQRNDWSPRRSTIEVLSAGVAAAGNGAGPWDGSADTPAPIEHSFYPDDLPEPVLPSLTYPQVLAPCAADININDTIMSMYLEHLLPAITRPGSDNNFGSAAMQDVLCLQALSQRIHYGKYVAEAKFRAQEEVYREQVERQDADALMHLLTDVRVEQQVVDRVRRKAELYGRDASASGSSEAGAASRDDEAPCKIAPEAVADLYARWLMPLNKQVQIAYLLRRLDPLSPSPRH
ncbi:hypothetical protein WJX84_001660 [Apatococcus fuscideae]|uniref:chorismate mutase n=1 Tax=Apatococcus fuscideae TaxID=2026836 RepID=A0AAW1SXH7_9CHLO